MERNGKVNGSTNIFCSFCLLMINVKGQIPSGENCSPGWRAVIWPHSPPRSSHSWRLLSTSPSGRETTLSAASNKIQPETVGAQIKFTESRNREAGNRTCFRDRLIPGLKHCPQGPASHSFPDLIVFPDMRLLQVGRCLPGVQSHTSHSSPARIDWESPFQNSQGKSRCLSNWR